MAQRFITVDNQILMACTGDEIEIVHMDRNLIHTIVQAHNHMIQSQRRSGRLTLKITDSLLEIVGHQYMSGLGMRLSNRYYADPICVVPPTHSFELAIVEGDTTDKSTWKMQTRWEGCLVDEESFETQPTLNNDELVMHTLPIDFADMQYYCEDKDCSSLLSEAPQCPV